MLLEEGAEEDGSVAAVAAEFDEVAFSSLCKGSLGEAEDFGGFGGGDLVVHRSIIAYSRVGLGGWRWGGGFSLTFLVKCATIEVRARCKRSALGF